MIRQQYLDKELVKYGPKKQEISNACFFKLLALLTIVFFYPIANVHPDTKSNRDMCFCAFHDDDSGVSK